MKRFPTLLLILSLLSVALPCFAEKGARVELFTPQGVAKGVRQVTARFSTPMTALGDPRYESPFTINCPEHGSGRWADVKNWVYDFDRDLPAGVACTFTLREGVKSLSGAAVTGRRDFSFSTGGPAITASRPPKGKTIDEEQIFVLTLDGEADPSSVLAKARFVVGGVAEPLGVEMVKGEERAAVLKAAGRPDNARTLTIRCRQRFPSKAAVKLIWGAGIASASGVTTAQDQVLEFTVRDRFTVAFQCERTKANAPCIPMTPMGLNFSAPVPARFAKAIVLKDGKKLYRPELSRDDDEGEEASKAQDDKMEADVRAVKFKGPFPEKRSLVIELPDGFTDDAGRPPANRRSFPLKVRTDAFPPLAKFAAPFGIVELDGDPAIPVTLRNVEPKVKARELGPEITVKQRIVPPNQEEGIINWLRKVRSAKRDKPLLGKTGTRSFTIPKPNGEKAFEVVGIPVPKPGLHIVELESPILGAALLEKKRPMFVSTAALVTNMSAHFKWGRESSLVWVTSLDKGAPVPDATVHVRDCRGKLYWQGKTDGEGIARIDKTFPENLPYCTDSRRHEKEEDYYADNDQPMLQGTSGGLFVFAAKGDDLTFVHSSWDRGIEEWRFNLPYAESRKNTLAHTVFDRTLVRAGDTIHMKHFVRTQVMKGFGLRKVQDLPPVLLVMHRGSEERYQFPLAWRGDNTAETDMALPKSAALGYYDVYLIDRTALKGKKGSVSAREEMVSPNDGWLSGFFRVEEFRVPLMKGVLEPQKEPAVNASSVELDLYVAHLSGGGAGGAPVKLRTQIKPRWVGFDDYEDYLFANGTVETGVVKEEAGTSYNDGEGEEAGESRQKPVYRTLEFKLDKTGAYRARIGDLPKVSAPQNLVAELEFRDPNGEIQTVTGRVPLWSSRLLVGVKPDSWTSSPETLKLKAVVLDLKGQPVSGARVEVEAFSRRHFSHRKRLVGGFYSYEHVTETRSLGPFCSGSTDQRGYLDCAEKAPASGNLILQATVRDEQANPSASHTEVWVAGKEEWWFEAGDSDRIDLLPEKKFYNPGETAKFQVRTPFRSATVLVTVEREGVMDAYVKEITGKEPVISVPVKWNYAPNVFVSALCVRGRVAGTKPTALFDPGKPAYRLGIGEIRVGRQAHELKVKVQADRDSYPVRGKARVAIKVARADGGALPKGAEVAVAAVDEGLLELMPNNSWKLLDAMMGRRGHEIKCSTAQSQVVGRRHFGLKALPAGGGGGLRSAREMFDTLLIWKGRVKLDQEGEATVEIPLNDSLTSFSVVAVADAGAGLFGTGRTTIRSTQDLMVLSGLPPLVRQGDRFTARFTVRNASAREMSLSATAQPSWSEGKGYQPIPLKLSPGEAKDVTWQAEVPAGIESASWQAQVKEENGAASDSIKVKQRVVPAVPVQVYQATVAQLDKPLELAVSRPEDALKGRGGVNVTVRPKLTDGVDGMVRYMKSYPYSCLEQRVSRAVALRDKKLWRQIVNALPSHLDGNGLAKYFPSPWLEGSPVLTAYILTIAREAGLELPDDLVQQMERGLIAFVEGRIRPATSFRTADLSIQKLSALEALSQRGKAEPKLLSSIAIEPNLWPTSALLDWLNIVKRTQNLPNRAKRLKEAEQILRSRLNFQGTVMNLSTEGSDRLWWLMVSTDANALRTLLAFMDEPQWRQDVPRLMRGAMARQKHGAWETTIANAWGRVTLDRFSQKFEAAAVTGSAIADLAGTVKKASLEGKSKGATLSFGWPDKPGQLTVRHSGGGKPWVSVTALAAIPAKKAISSGYRIKRTVTAIEQRDKEQWRRGDVARVRLEIEAQSDMTWVAVSDPVPSGAAILGSGLGRDSAIATEGERRQIWPAYEERAHEAYRAYFEFIPKGKSVTEYTVRFNDEGTFRLPPTRVEALYAPEMFGEAPNTPVKVAE